MEKSLIEKLISTIDSIDVTVLDEIVTELQELRQWQKDALQWLKLWRDHQDCDCPAEGHMCGFPQLDQFINSVKEEEVGS